MSSICPRWPNVRRTASNDCWYLPRLRQGDEEAMTSSSLGPLSDPPTRFLQYQLDHLSIICILGDDLGS